MTLLTADPLSQQALSEMSSLALAHVGDAVYELLVRGRLCAMGGHTARQLHRSTIGYVAATAQAKAAKTILPLLTPEEEDVYRRARNSNSSTVPHGCTPGEYHAATALEALFGWLYLRGEAVRIDELFNAAFEG